VKSLQQPPLLYILNKVYRHMMQGHKSTESCKSRYHSDRIHTDWMHFASIKALELFSINVFFVLVCHLKSHWTVLLQWQWYIFMHDTWCLSTLAQQWQYSQSRSWVSRSWWWDMCQMCRLFLIMWLCLLSMMLLKWYVTSWNIVQLCP